MRAANFMHSTSVQYAYMCRLLLVDIRLIDRRKWIITLRITNTILITIITNYYKYYQLESRVLFLFNATPHPSFLHLCKSL